MVDVMAVMVVMATSFKRTHACTAVFSAPDPAAATVDPCLRWRLLDTPRQVWLSLLRGHCFFLLGPGAYKVLFVPSKILFPQSCGISVVKCQWPPESNSLGVLKSLCWIPRLGNLLWVLENFFGIIVLQCVGCLLGGSMVGLMATSSKRAYATRSMSQVCCSQNPYPRGRPLLT